MRALVLIVPLVATACSSVLGFDDFADTGRGSGTDAGSGSDDSVLHVQGTLTSWTGVAISEAGVDFADRDGHQIAAQVSTDATGAFDVAVTKTNGAIDGYLHFTSGSYLDCYLHLPGPQTTGLQINGYLFTAGDLQGFAIDGGVTTQGNTGTLLAQFAEGPGLTLKLSDGPSAGDIRYFSDTTGSVAPIAMQPATDSSGLAIAFNLQDGVYVPDKTGGSSTRSYVVAPNTVVITLE
ncbi:MAG TPA: hypothetical protein VGM90_24955 [Kofleriaceae bacterium]|jgi:hypothetical protein